MYTVHVVTTNTNDTVTAPLNFPPSSPRTQHPPPPPPIFFSHTLIGRAEVPLSALKVKTLNSQLVHLTCPEGPAGDATLDIEVRPPAFPNSLDGKYRCTKILVRGAARPCADLSPCTPVFPPERVVGACGYCRYRVCGGGVTGSLHETLLLPSLPSVHALT